MQSSTVVRLEFEILHTKSSLRIYSSYNMSLTNIEKATTCRD